jgi:hypothetical protein
VTGDGVLSKLVYVLQLVGLSLADWWSVKAAMGLPFVQNSRLDWISDLAWPLSHLFMLVVAGMVIKAGAWRGWRRFAPLVCGLMVPVFFLMNASGARGVGLILGGIFSAVGFVSLGYAVRTEPLGARE